MTVARPARVWEFDRLFLDGAWTAAASKETLEVRDPSTPLSVGSSSLESAGSMESGVSESSWSPRP
jgi:hypothetical protein